MNLLLCFVGVPGHISKSDGSMVIMQQRYL